MLQKTSSVSLLVLIHSGLHLWQAGGRANSRQHSRGTSLHHRAVSGGQGHRRCSSNSESFKAPGPKASARVRGCLCGCLANCHLTRYELINACHYDAEGGGSGRRPSLARLPSSLGHAPRILHRHDIVSHQALHEFNLHCHHRFEGLS